MKSVGVNCVVTHRCFPKFVGVVIDSHPKLGFLVGWKHFEREGRLVRHLPQYIVCIEDAATIAALDAGEFNAEPERTYVDAGEFDGDPKELSLIPDHQEDEDEQEEQPGIVIEECADSEPLAEEHEEFEEVEDT
jgi:hypothetical protein